MSQVANTVCQGLESRFGKMQKASDAIDEILDGEYHEITESQINSLRQHIEALTANYHQFETFRGLMRCL